MNILQKLWFRFTHGGTGIEVVNNGKPVEELVIRYENLYFGIMVDAETGEPTGDFAWSDDFSMFPSTPVREFLEAQRKVDSDE